MYIYGGNVVQDGAVLVLYLTGSVCITAVILVGITVNDDLGGSGNYRRSLGGYRFYLDRINCRRCTCNHCCAGSGLGTCCLSAVTG